MFAVLIVTAIVLEIAALIIALIAMIRDISPSVFGIGLVLSGTGFAAASAACSLSNIWAPVGFFVGMSLTCVVGGIIVFATHYAKK